MGTLVGDGKVAVAGIGVSTAVAVGDGASFVAVGSGVGVDVFSVVVVLFSVCFYSDSVGNRGEWGHPLKLPVWHK